MSTTLCYCSSREGADYRPLAVCADCNAWLLAESPRIAQDWQDWFSWRERLRYQMADAIEAHNLAYFAGLR